MGGDYYERDVEETSSSVVYSTAADKVIGKSNSINYFLNPTIYSSSTLKCSNKHPIVFALDVTGSMGDWSKVNTIKKDYL